PSGAAPPTNTPAAIVKVSTGGSGDVQLTSSQTDSATAATSAAASHGSAPPQTHPSDPALRATMLEPLVQPGATQHIAVSYVANALVQATLTFPGAPPALLATIT